MQAVLLTRHFAAVLRVANVKHKLECIQQIWLKTHFEAVIGLANSTALLPLYILIMQQ